MVLVVNTEYEERQDHTHIYVNGFYLGCVNGRLEKKGKNQEKNKHAIVWTGRLR